MIEFNHLCGLLYDLNAGVGAAECHGFLCGQLCAASEPDPDLWFEFLDIKSDNDALVRQCVEEMSCLIADTRDQLQSLQFEFEPVLPAGGESMQLRVEALAEWCNGFLLGFDLHDADRHCVLSADGKSVLRDLSGICRAQVDPDSDEDDEKALMELAQYVKIGVIMIYEELHTEEWSDNVGSLH